MSKQAMYDAFKAGFNAGRHRIYIEADQAFQEYWDLAVATGQRGAFDVLGYGDNKTIAQRYALLRDFHAGMISREMAVTQLMCTGVLREDALNLTQKE